MNTENPSPDDIDLSNYVDIPFAARKLNLSKERVREFCREGRIGQKLMGVWMIEKAELEAFSKMDRPDGRRPDAR